MPTITKKLSIELPKNVIEILRTSREKAAAKQALIIGLWGQGKISTRVAAEALGMEYEDYLDLLSSKNIPVIRRPAREEVVRHISQNLNSAQ